MSFLEPRGTAEDSDSNSGRRKTSKEAKESWRRAERSQGEQEPRALSWEIIKDKTLLNPGVKEKLRNGLSTQSACHLEAVPIERAT